MNFLKKIEAYGDAHHPKWLDVLRIILGLLLFGKGLMFIRDTVAIEQILANSKFPWFSFAIAHYVAFAHLVGGVLITLGLLTRIAALVNLPVLIGAVIYVNAAKGFFSVNSELELSIIVLFLLVFFLVYGSGPISVDKAVKKNEEREFESKGYFVPKQFADGTK